MKGKARQLFILKLFSSDKYSCTKAGGIISYARYKIGRVRKGRIQKNGYELIGFYIQQWNKYLCISTHQLIYLYFKGEYDPKLQINHLDGNKLNNNISNLELLTSSDNHKYAYELGLETQKGEDNNLSKLRNQDIFQIRKLYASGFTGAYIAKQFKVTPGLI